VPSPRRKAASKGIHRVAPDASRKGQFENKIEQRCTRKLKNSGNGN